MRVGWLLWEDNLTEFLYFERRCCRQMPALFTPSGTHGRPGVVNRAEALWIFERETGQKRYSVTTSAGIKIQPYFDVPAPSDTNLYYFRVQSEPVNSETIQLWISASTAVALQRHLGTLTRESLSDAILSLAEKGTHGIAPANPENDLAVPVQISVTAHAALLMMWDTAVSDEHRAQLLLKALS